MTNKDMTLPASQDRAATPLEPSPQAVSGIAGIPSALDAGHVYVSRWPRSEHNPALCCHAVHEGGRSVGFHQCQRKPKIWREVTYHGTLRTLGYCATHDPVRAAARRDARNQQYKRHVEEQQRQWAEAARIRKLNEAAVEAIKKIAEGHNDPRNLACSVLAEFGAKP